MVLALVLELSYGKHWALIGWKPQFVGVTCFPQPPQPPKPQAIATQAAGCFINLCHGKELSGNPWGNPYGLGKQGA
jgi:hypothetical protein